VNTLPLSVRICWAALQISTPRGTRRSKRVRSEAVNRSRCKKSAETLSGIHRNRNVKHQPRQYTLFSGADAARTRVQRITKRPLARAADQA
jgi:hypothetical protein